MKIYDTDKVAHSLTKLRLTQADPQNGSHRYHVLLKDLKKIGKKGDIVAYCRECGKDGNNSFSVTVVDKSLRIGCTRFIGENAAAIFIAIG